MTETNHPETQKMPAFRPAAYCAKCRSLEVSEVWHTAREIPITSNNECVEITKPYALVREEMMLIPEHLHRRCQTCLYQWAEAPADASQES